MPLPLFCAAIADVPDQPIERVTLGDPVSGDFPAGTQIRLEVYDHAPAEHRVRALAGILAGFGCPDRGSFEKLTKAQQAAALDAARVALRRVEADA